MPRYHGPIIFVVELVGQLLWCYAMVAGVYILFGGGCFALLGAGWSGFSVVSVLLAADPANTIAVLHAVTLGNFMFMLRPRFPYAPEILTFTLAAVLGSGAGAAVWSAQHYAAELSPSGIAGWINVELEAIAGWFVAMIIASVVAGLFGYAIYPLVLKRTLFWSRWTPLRWLWWLTVGRTAFDDFLERERARVERSDPSNEVRRV